MKCALRWRRTNATGALVSSAYCPEPDAPARQLCYRARQRPADDYYQRHQNNLSPEAVDKTSELMHKARQVYCLSRGGSMYIAN